MVMGGNNENGRVTSLEGRVTSLEGVSIHVLVSQYLEIIWITLALTNHPNNNKK